MNKNLSRAKLNLIINDPATFLADKKTAKRTEATKTFQSTIRSQKPNLYIIHGDNK